MPLSLQLRPNTLREMYLCSSSLFFLKSAQHGHSGIRKGSYVCGLLSRCKSYRPTGGQKPAEKGVRKRSTLRTKAVTQKARWQYLVGEVYIGTKYSFLFNRIKVFMIVFIQIKYLRPLFSLSPFFP